MEIRKDRPNDSLRPVVIETKVNRYAEGSVLVSMGHTKVLCMCSVEDKVPPFKKESSEGWVTAEYSMLPRSTHTRSARESHRGKLSGRTMEIQRLIGRSLRAITDLSALDGFTLTIDCDVLQADGGTRTASITGGFIAFALACKQLQAEGKIVRNPIKEQVAAVSLGIMNQQVLLDLNYEEDFGADVDLNLVMTDKGRLVEIQGTGEETTFEKSQLLAMLDLGEKGILELCNRQRQALENS